MVVRVSKSTCRDAPVNRSLAIFNNRPYAVLVPNSSGQPSWRFGGNHSAQKWQKKLAQRGWTPQQISDAIQSGRQFPAVNNVNPGNAATRYVHSRTGRSVVVDDVTGEVIHVGGDGFVY
jgi:Colicin E5 ribonuclease domain